MSIFNKYCLTLCFSFMKLPPGKIYSRKVIVYVNDSTNIYSTFMHAFHCGIHLLLYSISQKSILNMVNMVFLIYFRCNLIINLVNFIWPDISKPYLSPGFSGDNPHIHQSVHHIEIVKLLSSLSR